MAVEQTRLFLMFFFGGRGEEGEKVLQKDFFVFYLQKRNSGFNKFTIN